MWGSKRFTEIVKDTSEKALILSHLGGDSGPPGRLSLITPKTAQDSKMKFFKFNLTLMGVILHIMTILINLRCCHGNLLL